MKLHYRDLTSSNNEFSSYAQSMKLILTTSTTHVVNNETLDLYILKERCCLNLSMKEDRQQRNFRCSSISHQPFYLLQMLERYTLSTTRFSSQSFDETGCDYFLFPTPGKKDHITIDIHYFALRLLRAKRRNNTASIRHPQQRKLHQQSLKV